MQPRKVKIMNIEAQWGPLKVWGPWGSIPCSPLPTQWACLDIVQYLTLTVYRSQGVMHTS